MEIINIGLETNTEIISEDVQIQTDNYVNWFEELIGKYILYNIQFKKYILTIFCLISDLDDDENISMSTIISSPNSNNGKFLKLCIKNYCINCINTNKFIIQTDLVTLIRSFKGKIKDDYPNASTKFIYLTTRQHPFMLEEVIGAIRSFEKIDFVKRLIVEFIAE